ncbi:MAG TPA: AAA family ATPase [Syntrophothermus lipocalidus]|nr:AAA family ATPase [Syntrophothermus lipocalidus]
MSREIALGSGIGILIFLAVLGVNVLPFIFFAGIIVAFYFFYQMQGTGGFKGLDSREQVGGLITFDDIGGQDSAIKELREALEFLLRPVEILEMGIRPLKGILLVGPPGTGKTLLARAAASYTKSSFLAASGSEFIEMYAGVGAKRVRQLFSETRKKARMSGRNSAILFIDELEVLGARRGSHQSHMEYDQTLNQLLVEMDGLMPDDETRLLVVGATNRADMLDPALLRPGRFDRQVMVSLPDKKGRIRILEIHTRNKPLADDVDMEDLGRVTFGFSGAHLESLANEAAILAFREGSKKIHHRHFREAVDKVILGEKLERTPTDEELRRVGVHESGHALVSELLQPGSVSSLTVVPRGQALGYMRKSPQDDQYLYTWDELCGQIMVALAGAISEEIWFGSRSTGAKSDFEQAWEIARQIVVSGLSPLGVVHVEDIPQEVMYNECSRIIKGLEDKTKELLVQNYSVLQLVAEKLLEEETLDRNQFGSLLEDRLQIAV